MAPFQFLDPPDGGAAPDSASIADAGVAADAGAAADAGVNVDANVPVDVGSRDAAPPDMGAPDTGPAGFGLTLGAQGNAMVHAIEPTLDAAFILAGSLEVGPGQTDGWMAKVSATGRLLWQKTYGGAGDDVFVDVARDVRDFVAVGHTFSFGGLDAWAVRIDADGNQEWSERFGGVNGEAFYGVDIDADGGYIFAGQTYSFGPATQPDAWLVRLNAARGLIRQQRYGGGANDIALAVAMDPSGDIVLTGATDSVSGDRDLWIWKVAGTSGAVIWSKSLHGPNAGRDEGFAIAASRDVAGGGALDGYVVAGRTGSHRADVEGWAVKLDVAGDLAWQTTIGGDATDLGRSLTQTALGAWVIGGESASFGLGNDAWITGLTSGGDLTWSVTLGGASSDRVAGIALAPGGGYVAAGDTASFGPAGGSAWMVRLGPQGALGCGVDRPATVRLEHPTTAIEQGPGISGVVDTYHMLSASIAVATLTSTVGGHHCP